LSLSPLATGLRGEVKIMIGKRLMTKADLAECILVFSQFD
jgi:hypothetical protein